MSEPELLEAAGAGDVVAVEALLAAGTRVNGASPGGETALMRAAAKGRSDVVQLLLKAGADVNARRADGMTPLIYAAFFGHADAAQLLIDSGADMEARDRLGMSAVDWAKSKGATNTADVLQGAQALHGRPSAAYHDAGHGTRPEEILARPNANPPAAVSLSPDTGPEVEDGAAIDASRESYPQIQTVTRFHYACIVLSLIIIFATLTWIIFLKH